MAEMVMVSLVTPTVAPEPLPLLPGTPAPVVPPEPLDPPMGLPPVVPRPEPDDPPVDVPDNPLAPAAPSPVPPLLISPEAVPCWTPSWLPPRPELTVNPWRGLLTEHVVTASTLTSPMTTARHRPSPPRRPTVTPPSAVSSSSLQLLFL